MKTIDSLLKQAQSDEIHSSISQSELEFIDSQTAAKAFAEYQNNLVDLDIWNQSGDLSSFDLFDNQGVSVSDNKIVENHLLRVYLKSSGKYDWLKVWEIQNNTTEKILTLGPTFDPQDKERQSVSHFFTEDSRNNFCLKLSDRIVSFYIIGLNEKQNVSQTDDFVEAVRNWVLANAGTYLGVQKQEWTSFAEKFLALGNLSENN